MYTHNKREKL